MEKGFFINPGWQVLIKDVGLNPANVLRRAGLPDDLFSREGSALDSNEYFNLWRGIEEEASDPMLPLHLGSSVSVEAFDPPIFAALCSPNLNVALERIAQYKKLICPMALNIEKTETHTDLAVEWLDKQLEPPFSLVSTELVFFVQLARIAIRDNIQPILVKSPHPPRQGKQYAEYFGVPIKKGKGPLIRFKAADAARPFLTVNEQMWKFFEPGLRKRLSELDDVATTSDRVQAALLELIPSGMATISSVSKKLHVSTRSLQRRLREEGQSFQNLFNATRADLAEHYLNNSALPNEEISFLLGFQDPSSFSRAYLSWTGKRPGAIRRSWKSAS